MALKADPFHNRRQWIQWKKTKDLKLNGSDKQVSAINKKLILEYLSDMEEGYNVATKGRLSFIRLRSIKQRITWILANMEIEDITRATDRQVLSFFNKMADGQITRLNGQPFQSTSDYAKVFAAFWHWYQRKERSHEVVDITRYVRVEENKDCPFAYFTPEELKSVSEHAKFEYRVLMWFLFDSGIRAPTELMSLRISDFTWLPETKKFELHIRDEYAKTFGRKIKLILSSDLLKSYLKRRNADEGFFTIDWRTFRRYLRRIFIKVLGDHHTKGGRKLSQLRPYDFRHSAACYWINRYKKEAGLKYRFGWKDNRMMHYYTKFLGMEDTITDQDILLDTDAKSLLEKELEKQKQTNILLEDRLKRLEEMVIKSSMVEANRTLSKGSPNLDPQSSV